MTAVSSSMIHMQQTETRVKLQDQSDEEIYDHCQNSNSRDASNCSPNYHHENDLERSKDDLDKSKTNFQRSSSEQTSNETELLRKCDESIDPNRQLQTSSFSMHNVLKVKTERESSSPETQNVFSTEKLLQNTPNCEIEAERHKQADYNEMSPIYRNDSVSSVPTPSPRFDSPETERYSNPNSVRVEINVDDESCCSEDTVLSVGNEAPLYTTAEEKGQVASPGAHQSNQGLTSFKHIQTHLNAISQLSQNLTMTQPLLLRPNPITPNPLLFLNQPHLLFQNPLLTQMEKQMQRPLVQSPLQTSAFGLNQFGRQQKANGLQVPPNPRPSDENRRLFNPRSPDSDDERRELIHNQNCLKFSIDNILKADFGRRITDPLIKRKTVKRQSLEVKSVPTKEVFSLKAVPKPSESRVPLDVRPNTETRVPEEKPAEKTGAIDLSKSDEGASSTPSVGSGSGDGPMVWPAWVYCTRYSDRPSSGRSKYGTHRQHEHNPTTWPPPDGPRTRRPKKPPGDRSPAADEKRPRTAFSGPQLARLKHEFAENRYLTERRRQQLAGELGLAEAQIKIWFQNKRAKIKKASGQRNPLALQLMAQGLYNHSTVPLTREEEELQELQARENKEIR